MFEVAQTPLYTPATPSPLDEVHQQILSILELEGTHEGCWYFAAAEVGGKDSRFSWDVFKVTLWQRHESRAGQRG